MTQYVRRALAAFTLCALLAGPAQAAPARNPVIEMVVANRGKVTLELYPKEAPKTVAHILDLVRKKFYDGILIHRVVPEFVVQAGDPYTKTKNLDDPLIGTGGSGKTIPLEVGKLTHETGTLGMARSQDPNSGDSQWFINLAPNHRLDGGYCVFGKVIKGMDVVKKIQRGDKIVRITEIKKKK